MKSFFNEYRNLIDTAEIELLKISEEESNKPYAPNKKWARKEMLGHLIDSAVNNHIRFVNAQLKTDLVFSGYEQDDWIKINDYNSLPWYTLIDLWRVYNIHLIHIISNIPEAKLKEECNEHNLDKIAWEEVNSKDPVTLEFLIKDYFGHMKHHLDQILK